MHEKKNENVPKKLIGYSGKNLFESELGILMSLTCRIFKKTFWITKIHHGCSKTPENVDDSEEFWSKLALKFLVILSHPLFLFSNPKIQTLNFNDEAFMLINSCTYQIKTE